MSQVSVLFTSRVNSWATHLIMWATGEPFSHVAIRYGDFVVHSTFKGGLNVESYYHFIKNNSIYDEIEVSGDANTLLQLLGEHEKSTYDIGAFFFLGLSLLARKYLKIPLPKSNLWQATGMFLCSGWVTKYLNQKENDMATPGDIYNALGGPYRFVPNE